MEPKCGFSIRRRGTPIPVAPPRVPTPMPLNNNNGPRLATKEEEPGTKSGRPMSSGSDIPKLISKTPYKLLDNDVKTAWINPRLISKINLDLIKKSDYIPNHQQAYENNINCQIQTVSASVPNSQIPNPTLRMVNISNGLNQQKLTNNVQKTANNSSNIQKLVANTGPYSQQMATNSQLLYQKQVSCSRSHDQRGLEKEWETNGMNGRVAIKSRGPSLVSTPTIANAEAKRIKGKQPLSSNGNKSKIPTSMDSQQISKVINNQKQQKSRFLPQFSNKVSSGNKVSTQNNNQKQYYQQFPPSAAYYQQTAAYYLGINSVQNANYNSNGANLESPNGAVTSAKSAVPSANLYGVYAETKYVYQISGVPLGNPAQASAAAAFFARAAQKLNLSASSSPHRRKRYNSESEGNNGGFCGILQKSPPPVPPALLRRIGVKEVTGVGKVKVMLRLSHPVQNSESSSSNSFFSLDKRKKQVTLVDPTLCNGMSAPEDRRVGVAAPKMFAFDAIFSQDDSQSEVCSSALTDVIHAVINGTDGCLFCFGHAGLGKSYTMLGTPDSANTLGVIPCAISWLFKGINEQKQKTGARFSVRVSAVEVCGPTNQLKDLLTGFSSDSEQSPGMYLRDDPLFVNQPPHCELRVPTAEKAAYYLDAALEGRSQSREESRDSHLLFTLHVYQYSVAGKGGVAGGRSRLHLIDLGNSERGKSGGGIPLSGLGNILLAIFNGQKHLPYKEHKLTHLLKDCLSSLTCHAAMIVHISPIAQNYAETLTTVQLASRIHRMRRRKIKFVSVGAGNGSGGSSSEEAARTTGTSSEPDPSSSDLSADTVIYVGNRNDDATDGEHPPVYLPSLNSGDNRCSMSKALRGSSAEQKPSSTKSTPDRTSTHRPSPTAKPQCQSNKSSPVHAGSPKQSPSRIPSIKNKADSVKHTLVSGNSDEQWIDGPRISKSKVAEARHFMKEPCHVKKRETWVDGPMQSEPQALGYGYMDSHKKNMIRKWVEHQTIQIQKCKSPHNRSTPEHTRHTKDLPNNLPKELTQFKSFEDSEETHQSVVKPLNSCKKVENIEESTIRTGLKMNSGIKNDSILECESESKDKVVTYSERVLHSNSNVKNYIEEIEDDEEETPVLPPALPLIQPLSSREVSLESLDKLLQERMLSQAEYNSYHSNNSNYDNSNYDDLPNEEDEILEIIEVEEPLEPVPTQDSCLQVTEEDIAFCMGYSENPLPEVDQENPLDHPLRILSQENLTIVSTFTDSMSVYTDLERIIPRHRYERYCDDYEDPDNPPSRQNGNLDDQTRRKFDQLARLHELYTNRLAKATVANSSTYRQECEKPQQRNMVRCESLTLNDMLYGNAGCCDSERDCNAHDNSSIYSEPAYVQEKFCENCKMNMGRPATGQNWYDNHFLSTSTQDLSHCNGKGRFQNRHFCRYNRDIAFLRHPDGASNPNLQDSKPSEKARLPGNGACSTERLLPETYPPTKLLSNSITAQPVIAKPDSLPSMERLNRAILTLESGVAQVKLAQKSEGYDSGHDSTPRTSKHSPAAISRRAESGYDSIVRDSENSSIDSEPSRSSHVQRRGKCKHKHEKSFCSWFLNPFTCKYIDEPPETHF